ncbi:MAG: ribonuclease Z [Clostridia bacterium]|nr:ribonuclease Z [Clostridia bacterium]
MIEMTLIGTAATMPLPERAVTAATLSCAGHSILFDCGEGTQSAARKAHAPIMRADAICLTHYHGDHIFGLPGYLQTMGSLGRTEPLYIFGPEGLEEIMAPILALCVWLPYEVRLMPLPKDGLHLCDVMPGWPAEATLYPVATQHRIASQGYRFSLSRPGRFMVEKARALNIPQKDWGRLQRGESVEVDGRIITSADVLGEPRKGLSVVFTGDTQPCDAVREAAHGADLLIMEATYGENEQADLAADHGHSTFAQTAQLAAEAEVKRLWLVHYSAMITDPEEYLANAQAFYPNAVCGQDGMQITLAFSKD